MSGGSWPPREGDGYYDDPAYEWSEPSGWSQSGRDGRARGRADQYDQDAGQGTGRHSGGQPAAPYGDSYGQDAFRQDAYRQDQYGESYSQGWQLGNGDQGGRDGYDQGGYSQGSYGQGGYGSYGEPGYGRDGYSPDPSADRYAGGSYGQDGYGSDGYGRDGYGQDGYGQDGYSYGRDQYGQPGYGSTASYQADSRDTGWSGQSPDTGSFGRADTGSFGRADSGSFGRADTGSFGASDGYLGDGQPDPFGPPAASLRRPELGGSTAGRLGDWREGADDHDGWDSDDAAEHDRDWQDDADSGLLSRRFGDGDDGRGGRMSPRRAARLRRPKRLRGKVAFTAAILAGALVLGAVADYGFERYRAWHTGRYGDYTGAGTGQVKFEVPQGAVLDSLGPALMKAGVIMEVRPFDSAAAAATGASHLQPGIYLLHKHMSSALAVQYLLSSKHLVNDRITIIEGMRASAIAQALAKQTHLPVSQFTQIINHPPASLGLPSWAHGKVEGFLFPDTYPLLPNLTALQILQKMVAEFKQKVTAVNLVGEAKHVNISPYQALVAASLIQAEAGSVSDFGKISRVIWNRIGNNMPLEFDSTVFYAMGIYGTAVNSQQRNFKSPYNTYLHTDLPPGPIGNPGILAIQAAVHATQGQWLYFLANTKHKPYKTYFFNTLGEFQAAQRRFGV
jgi:UPF0755 protein